MCSLAVDEEMGRRLKVALLRQRQKALETDDPIKVLRRTLDNLVTERYETVSITHVALEMRYVLSLSLGSSFLTGLPEWLSPNGWAGSSGQRGSSMSAPPALGGFGCGGSTSGSTPSAPHI